MGGLVVQRAWLGLAAKHRRRRTDQRPEQPSTSATQPSNQTQPPRSFGDQTDAPLKGDVRHGPFHEHHQTISKTDEHEDVQEEPCHPRQQAREARPTEVGDSRAPANDGHVAEVPVDERSATSHPSSGEGSFVRRAQPAASPSARRRGGACPPGEGRPRHRRRRRPRVAGNRQVRLHQHATRACPAARRVWRQAATRRHQRPR